MSSVKPPLKSSAVFLFLIPVVSKHGTAGFLFERLKYG